MRRFPVCVLIPFVASLAMGNGAAFALSESDIQASLNNAESVIQGDWTGALSYTCGGLRSAGDLRALAYEGRRPQLGCDIKQWCSKFDETTGDCTGKLCTVERFPASDPRVAEMWLSDCTAGSCVPVQPRTSCFTEREYFGMPRQNIVTPRKRSYACKSGITSGITAECYSYLPDFPSASDYFPFEMNCVLAYPSSPLDPAEPTKGRPALVSPFDALPPTRAGAGVFEPVPGSSASTASVSPPPFPRDSSMGTLMLDDAANAGANRVMHPTTRSPFSFTDYPDLSRTIGDLVQPPEVRLILPEGGVGGAGAGSPLFSRLFSDVPGVRSGGPVVRALGSEPDALLLAAEYLRSIPLLEVRYVPVDVLVPSVSETEITQVVAEWEAWLAAAGSGLDAGVADTVRDNIATLRSYRDLKETVLATRNSLPEYLNALLGYTEDANRFFREEWVEVNAQRLEDWHNAFTAYLMPLRDDLKRIGEKAAAFTAQCLVPACRMDAVPVKSGVGPWDLVPPGSAFPPLTGADRAWSSEGFPLWERLDANNQRILIGESALRHPLETIGLPLPDITLDLSEVFLRGPIVVQLPRVEMVQLGLQRPPPVSFATDPSGGAALKDVIRPLPRFHPPLQFLEFPTLVLPDPETSLFVVPPPPKELPTWIAAIAWKEQRLDELMGICDSSPGPKIFLASEFDLRSNPTRRRAASLTTGAREIPWPPGDPPSRTSFAPSLVSPPPCSGPACAGPRPQRFIRQHMELDLRWERFQDRLLTAVDEWNAQVKFFSVVPRDELVTEERDYRPHSSLFKFLR